ncbi:MAG: hypothetical protein BWK80_01720 [Desulfobacteraceae bacterium IS3]|nr:MAG: hypothetical protein BWK80_01720 [Desulfobacteraceae bacterium IS3]
MKKQEYPHCFGVLDIVFPKGEDGLRSTPEHCFVCFCKTECLKTAMGKSDGMKVQEEVIDRAYQSGMMGFLERWSKKKSIHRNVNEQNNGKDDS